MVRPQGSRKGKRQWRKHIDQSEVVHALEARTARERDVTNVEGLPSKDLFFEDKVGTEPGPSTAEPAPLLSVRQQRKLAARAKVSNAWSVSAGAAAKKPVSEYQSRKQRAKFRAQPPGTQGQAAGQVVAARKAGKKRSRQHVGEDSSDAGEDYDLWHVPPAGPPTFLPAAAPTTRRVETAPPAHAAAVEVDPAGCSYNPAYEQHQEALAGAVAHLVGKQLRQELEPKAPSGQVVVQVDEEGGAREELGKLLAYHQIGSAAEVGEHVAPQDDSAEEEAAEQEEEATEQLPSKPTSKKTRTQRNKQLRHREELEAAAKRRELKSQRRQLEHLSDVMANVSEAERHMESIRQRRKADREERQREAPPKLGKHRFQGAAPPVLLSDELPGSLRRLKGSTTVVKDRYQSVLRRGLMEVRNKRHGERKKRITYEKGERAARLQEQQQEIEELRRDNQMLRSKKRR